MKYGLVYYKYTDNLGDDILSYAAKQFLPNIDYYIDRESMDIFVPNEDEAVAVILNGWFLHIFQSFPPSPFIKPLFIGTHFRKDENLFHDYSYLESKTAKNFLKKYEPIGCRDRNTNEVLNKIGIQSYFSGCLTLTLKPFSDIENNHKIILTDVPKEIETYVKCLLPEKDIITQTHLIPDEKRGASWQSREQCLEEHLKLYQGADLVITTRLHCALPSIALGTKTILISKYDEDWKKRISDFAEYCTMFSAQDILDKKADRLLLFPELIENEGIKKLQEKISETCKDFIRNVKNNSEDNLPNRDDYIKYYVERTEYLRRSNFKFYQVCSEISSEYERVGNALVHSKSIIDRLLQENENLNKLIAKLNKN